MPGKTGNRTIKRIAVNIFGAAFLMSAIFLFMYFKFREILLCETEKSAKLYSEVLVNKLEQSFLLVRTTAMQLKSQLENTAPNDKDLQAQLPALMNSLSKYPEIYSCRIVLSPETFSQGQAGKFYYVCRDERHNKCTVFNGENNKYCRQEWFSLPRQLSQPIWTEPDCEGGESKNIVTVFSVPVYMKINGHSSFRGIAAIGLSLTVLQEEISKFKLFDNGYVFMLSRFGKIAAHPDRRFILESAFGMARRNHDVKLYNIVKMMTSGQKWACRYVESGRRNHLFPRTDAMIVIAPLATTGWSVAAIIPHQDFLGELNQAAAQTVPLILFMLAAVGVVSMKTAKHF